MGTAMSASRRRVADWARDQGPGARAVINELLIIDMGVWQ
jgi:hypothetical protein